MSNSDSQGPSDQEVPIQPAAQHLAIQSDLQPLIDSIKLTKNATHHLLTTVLSHYEHNPIHANSSVIQDLNNLLAAYNHLHEVLINFESIRLGPSS